MPLHGIDVYNLSGTIDWRRVAATGIRFAYLKASEGQDFPDTQFVANRAGAVKYKLTVGAYHYAHPGSNTPEEEVDQLLKLAMPRQGELVPALDIEAPPRGKERDWAADITIPVPQRVRWVRRWLSLVEREIGKKPVLYVNRGYWENQLGRMSIGEYPLWLAAWTTGSPTLPAAWRRYAIWQYSDTGGVDGVPKRNVDHNVADAAVLRTLLYGSSEPADLKNGDLIRPRGRKQVYLIDRGRKRPIPDASTLRSKWTWGDVIDLAQSVVDAFPKGASFPALTDPIVNDDLVRAPAAKTVYLIDDGARRAIPDAATFLSRWQWYEVRVLDPDAVESVPLGEPFPSVA